MGFSMQEYWSGLPFPSPGDLPDPGIEPGSPALEADTLTSERPGKPPEQDILCKFSSNTGTHPWASIYRQLKLFQNHWHLITHYWTLHCTPERRNPAPATRTPTQPSLTKKPWQATDTTPPTVRKLHNKENSSNSPNVERPPQIQQYNQDEEIGILSR